jgi:hypothetical protein
MVLLEKMISSIKNQCAFCPYAPGLLWRNDHSAEMVISLFEMVISSTEMTIFSRFEWWFHQWNGHLFTKSSYDEMTISLMKWLFRWWNDHFVDEMIISLLMKWINEMAISLMKWLFQWWNDQP